MLLAIGEASLYIHNKKIYIYCGRYHLITVGLVNAIIENRKYLEQ